MERGPLFFMIGSSQEGGDCRSSK